MVSCLDFWLTPLPSHEPQYLSTTCPVPPHVGQRAALLLHAAQDRVHRLDDRATTAAGAARVDRRARRNARAGAGLAGLEVGDTDLLRAAEERRVEVDLQIEAQVVALRRARPPPSRTRRTLTTKEGFKDVADVKVARARTSAAGAAHARHAELVVALAHRWIREHLMHASLIVWNFSLAPGSELTSGCHLRAAAR